MAADWTVRSVSMVTTAGPARRIAAATKDCRPRTAAAGWARPGEVRLGLTRAVVAVTVAVAAAVTVASPAAAAARTREERIVNKLGWKNRRQVPGNEKGEANRPDRL